MRARFIAAFLAPMLLITAGCGVSNTSNTANTTTEHTVALTWDPEPSSIKGYNIYRGSHSGGPYSRIASFVSLNSYNDKAVSSGQTYYYVVTAIGLNSVESGYSDEAVATIP